MSALNALLASLFRLHHGDLVRYATRLVGDRDCGEEIAQDVYVRIAGRGSLGEISHPKTYLFTAARNTAIDIATARRIEKARRADLSAAGDFAAPNDAERFDDRRRRLVQLSIALNELPSACRQAFIMNKLKGTPHREIARRMGISVSMVEKHMMRALSHCRNVVRENDLSVRRD